MAHDFYQGYCKSYLWPALHNVLEVYDSAFDVTDSVFSGFDDATLRKCWDAYNKVNTIFAENIAYRCVELYNLKKEEYTTPTVWVHSYHMMLVPRLVQQLMMEHIVSGSLDSSDSRPPLTLKKDWSSKDRSRDVLRSLTDKLNTSDKRELYEQVRPHVVFFMHEPMPTFEVFRTLGSRTFLLEGILGR